MQITKMGKNKHSKYLILDRLRKVIEMDKKKNDLILEIFNWDNNKNYKHKTEEYYIDTLEQTKKPSKKIQDMLQ